MFDNLCIERGPYIYGFGYETATSGTKASPKRWCASQPTCLSWFWHRFRPLRLPKTVHVWTSVACRTYPYSMLCNDASGAESGLPGRILAGLLPGKHPNRPSGQPEGRFRYFPGSSPPKIQPGRPISGPEAVLCNIEYIHNTRTASAEAPPPGCGPPKAGRRADSGALQVAVRPTCGPEGRFPARIGVAIFNFDFDFGPPYKFIGCGDIHGPKPYKFIRFGDIHGPKPYNFIGFCKCPAKMRPGRPIYGPEALSRSIEYSGRRAHVAMCADCFLCACEPYLRLELVMKIMICF